MFRECDQAAPADSRRGLISSSDWWASPSRYGQIVEKYIRSVLGAGGAVNLEVGQHCFAPAQRESRKRLDVERSLRAVQRHPLIGDEPGVIAIERDLKMVP